MNVNTDISNVTLETKRLILRPFQIYDLDDFYEYAKVDGMGQMAGWLPEAVKEIICYCLYELQFDFSVCHFVDNQQSRCVQEKCGLKHYKVVKYKTRYGIEKDGGSSILENQ